MRIESRMKNTIHHHKIFFLCKLQPKSADRNTHAAHVLDSTAKPKITAEPMGATHILHFTVKPITCTSYRASICGLGFNAL